MNKLIDDIYSELKEKYGLSKVEIERITDAQFKATAIHIERYTMKDIKWIHLGKIKPSDYIKHKIERDERAKLVTEI